MFDASLFDYNNIKLYDELIKLFITDLDEKQNTRLIPLEEFKEKMTNFIQRTFVKNANILDSSYYLSVDCDKTDEYIHIRLNANAKNVIDASNGDKGLAKIEDLYTLFTEKVGLNSSLNIDWDEMIPENLNIIEGICHNAQNIKNLEDHVEEVEEVIIRGFNEVNNKIDNVSTLLDDVSALAEKKSNKVLSINETSDDAHYPSAKAVYTALENKKSVLFINWNGSSSGPKTYQEVKNYINQGYLVIINYNNNYYINSNYVSNTTSDYIIYFYNHKLNSWNVNNGYFIRYISQNYIYITSGNNWNHSNNTIITDYIVNNLTTNYNDRSLSAAQGYQLLQNKLANIKYNGTLLSKDSDFNAILDIPIALRAIADTSATKDASALTTINYLDEVFEPLLSTIALALTSLDTSARGADASIKENKSLIEDVSYYANFEKFVAVHHTSSLNPSGTTYQEIQDILDLGQYPIDVLYQTSNSESDCIGQQFLYHGHVYGKTYPEKKAFQFINFSKDRFMVWECYDTNEWKCYDIKSNEVYFATYGTTTYENITNAINDGKAIFVENTDGDGTKYIAQYQYTINNTHYFCSGIYNVTDGNDWSLKIATRYLKQYCTTVKNDNTWNNENRLASVPLVQIINSLTSDSSTQALSAQMGTQLQEEINNLKSIGRFLSIWDCSTGKPQSNPQTSPYTYNTGDYFIIGNVNTLEGGKNYRPDGSTYTKDQSSTKEETEQIAVSDQYFYDGTGWMLQTNHARSIAVDEELSTTSTNPVQNKIITNKLNVIDSSINDVSNNKASKTYVDNLDTSLKTYVDEHKAEKATNLAGYGITDAVKTVNKNTPDVSGNVNVTAFTKTPYPIENGMTTAEYLKEFSKKVKPVTGSAYLASGSLSDMPCGWGEIFIYVPKANETYTDIVYVVEVSTTNSFAPGLTDTGGKWMGIYQYEHNDITQHMSWKGVMTCPYIDIGEGSQKKRYYIPDKDSDAVSKYWFDTSLNLKANKNDVSTSISEVNTAVNNLKTYVDTQDASIKTYVDTSLDLYVLKTTYETTIAALEARIAALETALTILTN